MNLPHHLLHIIQSLLIAFSSQLFARFIVRLVLLNLNYLGNPVVDMTKPISELLFCLFCEFYLFHVVVSLPASFSSLSAIKTKLRDE